MTATTLRRVGRHADWVQCAASAYDPFVDLAGRDGVSASWHPDGPDSPCGLTSFDDLHISLARGMDTAQLKCTLTHELVHLERGPLARRPDPLDQAAEERVVEILTAQRLVCPWDRELLWAHAAEQVAPALGVDTAVLLAYDYWRESVTRDEAIATWKASCTYPRWPVPWMRVVGGRRSRMVVLP